MTATVTPVFPADSLTDLAPEAIALVRRWLTEAAEIPVDASAAQF